MHGQGCTTGTHCLASKLAAGANLNTSAGAVTGAGEGTALRHKGRMKGLNERTRGNKVWEQNGMQARARAQARVGAGAGRYLRGCLGLDLLGPTIGLHVCQHILLALDLLAHGLVLDLFGVGSALVDGLDLGQRSRQRVVGRVDLLLQVLQLVIQLLDVLLERVDVRGVEVLLLIKREQVELDRLARDLLLQTLDLVSRLLVSGVELGEVLLGAGAGVDSSHE